MGRPKNKKYWAQVEKLEDGRWRCKKCKRDFTGGASRIKAHVEGIRGQGIDVCSGSADPGSVRENEGVDNINVTVGPSNSQVTANVMNPLEAAAPHAHEMTYNNIIGSSSHQTGTDLIDPFGGWTPGDARIGSNHGPSPLESEISHLKQSVRDLSLEEDDIKGQLQWLESRGKKRRREVDGWLKDAEHLKKVAEDLPEEAEEDLKEAADDVNYFTVDFVSPDDWRESIQHLTEKVRRHKKQKPLVLSNEFVGEGFETNMKKIWEFLGDDQVFIIGVNGIGGVGKTALVTHAKNEIIRKGTFKHVFWVTVSRDFSIFKLQNEIAKRIGVKLDDEDEIMRATNLSSALERKEKSVLILDDVWKNIDLEKVGIPLGVNGVKMILTSRLRHVCRQMDCLPNNIIQMKPFRVIKEVEELFLLKLGCHGKPAILPPNVLEIARSVARECYDLPLGISVMARTMKGVEDIHRWRHTLNKLQNSAMEEEMEEEVFNVLKLSYDNLNDKNMQNCFLYSALYLKSSNHYLRREDFIGMLVEEGLINGMRSLEKIFDEGLSILDKLIDHSLLSMDDDNDRILMHGLVKEMAWHILKGSHRWMVKCNKGLTEIPHMQEWTADLEKVSLNSNVIEEIPAGTSPCCARLCTFIFRDNPLICIPDCFFSHMNALTVLDLSFNRNLTCLPNSVSNLRSLVSLLLEECKSLEYVPPLGELQALSRLIISKTSIKEVPHGLEKLINLKWLDLSWNNKLFVPGSVLAGLTNLQYLDLRVGQGSARVNAEDVLGLSVLHYFGGSFSNCENFNDFVEKTQDRGFRPKSCYLCSGFRPGFYSMMNHNPWDDEKRIVYFRNCEEFLHLLPVDLAKLYISNNEQWKCLCDALSFNGSSSLTLISICHCPTLVSLLCLSGSCRFCTHLQNLESLDLDHLESLAVIWKDTRFLPPGGVFSNLKHLKICGCDKMEKLLTSGSLPQFQKLESIIVDCCGSLREIFSEESIEGGDNNDSVIELPKLKKLELSYLPQLKTVCRGIMVCESSDILTTEWCPNLERRPTIKEFDS